MRASSTVEEVQHTRAAVSAAIKRFISLDKHSSSGASSPTKLVDSVDETYRRIMCDERVAHQIALCVEGCPVMNWGPGGLGTEHLEILASLINLVKETAATQLKEKLEAEFGAHNELLEICAASCAQHMNKRVEEIWEDTANCGNCAAFIAVSHPLCPHMDGYRDLGVTGSRKGGYSHYFHTLVEAVAAYAGKRQASIQGTTKRGTTAKSNKTDANPDDNELQGLEGAQSGNEIVSFARRTKIERWVSFDNLCSASLSLSLTHEEYAQRIQDATKELIAVVQESCAKPTLETKFPFLNFLWGLSRSAKAKELGLSFTEGQIRLLLLRGLVVLEALCGGAPLEKWLSRAKKQIEATTLKLRGGSKLTKNEALNIRCAVDDLRLCLTLNENCPWLSNAASKGIEPLALVEHFLAMFVYTCTLKGEAESKFTSLEAVEKDGQRMNVKPAPPKNFPAHGPRAQPWAITNWALRVIHDKSQGGAHAAAKEALDLLSLFKEYVDKGLMMLPQERVVTFRGIKIGGIVDGYTTDSVITFAPFTSTAISGDSAMEFVDPEKPGTLFVLRARYSSKIHYVSWYPEQQESLLGTYSTFRVKYMLSRTLLRMLGCLFDVVVLQEDKDSREKFSSEQEQDEIIEAIVQDFVNSNEKILFVFRRYLRSYVEPSVKVVQQQAHQQQPKTSKLFTCVEEWLMSEVENAVILGEGGAGKSSALLAVYSRLAERKRFIAGKRVIPVFLSLPSVRGLYEIGGIDKRVIQILGFADRRSASKMLFQNHVVLFLDSLDECSALSAATVRFGLLDRNQFSSQCRCILSCRTEILKQYGVLPTDLLLGSHRANTPITSLYVLPFSSVESSEMCKKYADIYDVDAIPLMKGVSKTSGEIQQHPMFLSIFLTVVLRGFMPMPRVRDREKDEDDASGSDDDDSSCCSSDMDEECATAREGKLPRVFRMYQEEGAGKDKKFSQEKFEELHSKKFYEVYLSQACLGKLQNKELRDAALQAMERLSLRMLDTGSWHTTIRKMKEEFGESLWDQCYMYLPLRTESIAQPDATVQWGHRSFGEYLAARALLTNFDEAHKFISRPFTCFSPAVLNFFADLAQAEKTHDEKWKQLCTKIEGLNGCELSNLLGLMGAWRPLYNLSLTNKEIVACNLNRCLIAKCDFSHSTLDDCSITGCKFIECSFEQTRFLETTAGSYREPIECDIPASDLYLRPDGEYLVVVHRKVPCAVQVYSMENNVLVKKSFFPEAIVSVKFFGESSIIAVGAYSVVKWDFEKNTLSFHDHEFDEFNGHGDFNGYDKIALPSDLRRFALFQKNSFRVFDFNSGAVVRRRRVMNAVHDTPCSDDERGEGQREASVLVGEQLFAIHFKPTAGSRSLILACKRLVLEYDIDTNLVGDKWEVPMPLSEREEDLRMKNVEIAIFNEPGTRLIYLASAGTDRNPIFYLWSFSTDGQHGIPPLLQISTRGRGFSFSSPNDTLVWFHTSASDYLLNFETLEVVHKVAAKSRRVRCITKTSEETDNDAFSCTTGLCAVRDFRLLVETDPCDPSIIHVIQNEDLAVPLRAVRNKGCISATQPSGLRRVMKHPSTSIEMEHKRNLFFEAVFRKQLRKAYLILGENSSTTSLLAMNGDALVTHWILKVEAATKRLKEIFTEIEKESDDEGGKVGEKITPQDGDPLASHFFCSVKKANNDGTHESYGDLVKSFHDQEKNWEFVHFFAFMAHFFPYDDTRTVETLMHFWAVEADQYTGRTHLQVWLLDLLEGQHEGGKKLRGKKQQQGVEDDDEKSSNAEGDEEEEERMRSDNEGSADERDSTEDTTHAKTIKELLENEPYNSVIPLKEVYRETDGRERERLFGYAVFTPLFSCEENQISDTLRFFSLEKETRKRFGMTADEEKDFIYPALMALYAFRCGSPLEDKRTKRCRGQNSLPIQRKKEDIEFMLKFVAEWIREVPADDRCVRMLLMLIVRALSDKDHPLRKDEHMLPQVDKANKHLHFDAAIAQVLSSFTPPPPHSSSSSSKLSRHKKGHHTSAAAAAPLVASEESIRAVAVKTWNFVFEELRSFVTKVETETWNLLDVSYDPDMNREEESGSDDREDEEEVNMDDSAVKLFDIFESELKVRLGENGLF